MHSLRNTISAAGLLCLAPNLPASQAVDLEALQVAVRDRMQVESFTVQGLELPSAAGSGFTTEVDLGAHTLTLELEPYVVRGLDFRLLVADGLAPLRESEPPPPRTIRGRIAALPGSLVVGNLVDGRLNVIVESEVIGTWAIQPLSEVDPEAGPGEHLVYDVNDARPLEDWTCLELWDDQAEELPGEAVQGTGMKWCEIAFDCDVEFFERNGSSVEATVHDVELVMNRVDAIYGRDVDIRFGMGIVVVRTSEPDPYAPTDAGNLLNVFRNHWQANMQVVKRDVTHLMTGKNLNGSTIGVAYLNGICNNSRYGLSQSRFSGSLNFRAGLTAHEIGHNYSAQHCSGSGCFIMCAGLGGCGGDVTRFGTQSINAITNYSATRTCTRDLAPPLGLDWTESFEVVSIDEDVFPSWQGAETSLLADNEPDGAFSLNLDAADTNSWSQDFVRSNYIDLEGQPPKAIVFQTQHKGVEAAEALELRYLNDEGLWMPGMTVVSDGVDQTVFESHFFNLPADAYHDEFRVGLRALVNGPDDEWFVDLLAFGEGCAPVTRYCLTSPNSFGTGAVIDWFGGTTLSANDFSLLVTGAAQNQFGLFYYGTGQTQLPFGNGFRCVSGSITRMSLAQTNAFGEVFQDFDAVSEGVNVGDALNFQFWFRDPMDGGAAFNLSDALATEWCP